MEGTKAGNCWLVLESALVDEDHSCVFLLWVAVTEETRRNGLLRSYILHIDEFKDVEISW